MPMMRAIDKGLVNSRVGIVLVTPAMLRRLRQKASQTRSFRRSYGVSGSSRLSPERPMKSLSRSASC